jgi:hypothetical protein
MFAYLSYTHLLHRPPRNTYNFPYPRTQTPQQPSVDPKAKYYQQFIGDTYNRFDRNFYCFEFGSSLEKALTSKSRA